MSVGTFDHTIQMQAKGQSIVAVTQYGRYPGFVLGTIASKAIAYGGPHSLKGLKIGVTSPGSSTHFMAGYMLVAERAQTRRCFVRGHGRHVDRGRSREAGGDRRHRESDPMVSLMQGRGRRGGDTRTPEGTQAVYGGPYPGGVVYTTPAFSEKNPRTVQAIVTAFVRALKWMSSHQADAIANAMPGGVMGWVTERCICAP